MVLNDDNFLIFAMRTYDKSQCHSIAEFEEDIRRFVYIKKLLLRYKQSDELKTRLILNHIIVLYNCFGDSATNMLLYRVDRQLWSPLITFLLFLGRMPEYVKEHDLRLDSVVVDPLVVQELNQV